MINATLQAQIEAVLKSLAGWCTPRKAAAMCDLILAVKPRIVVEIGVFGGSSLIPQALALKDNGAGMIHGVDPWTLDSSIEGEQDPANIDWWKQVNLDVILEDFYKALLSAQVLRQVTIHPVPSVAAAEHFGNGSIEILHIDGCHSEISSTRDVRTWLPKVANGGYIWFDDTDWPSTLAAVSILNSKATEIFRVGSCALFLKGTRRNFYVPCAEPENVPVEPVVPASIENPEIPAPEHILVPSAEESQ